ncbi:large conductance mechanosensitive channel protein MscL [Knoellia sp. Soil729]|uniref:large conductance mechanosensitive channel protein MscL n=1 Tax=Knoellia sp. Soil729 TaxID=1736394 RepID=UPI0006FC5D19|nr:large conductance mechanosensitive channel protein MscL [Knoellia sp. Soil729]KRE44004.1 mechanosensitive ion channel protein MscL [Knoellia sp. Soil729]
MKGFKDFVMRGNLVELAVAFVIAGAFGEVVKKMVDVIMSIVGKAGDQPDFNAWKPGDVPLGAFITALIAFLILAAVVYFFVVKPYTAAQERFFPAEPETDTVDPNTELLKEIRDSLRARPNL